MTKYFSILFLLIFWPVYAQENQTQQKPLDEKGELIKNPYLYLAPEQNPFIDSVQSAAVEEKKEDDYLKHWDGRLRLGLGGAVSVADKKETYSAEIRPQLELSYRNNYRADLDVQIMHDLNDRSTDPVKLKTWFIARAGLEALPIELWGKENKDDKDEMEVRLGLSARAEIRENTPSSEEHAYLAYGGPTLRIENEKITLRFIAGGHYYSLELDDDLPAKRGFSRKDLFLDTFGPALAAEGVYRGEYCELGLSGRALIDCDGSLREVMGRSYIELPLLKYLGGESKYLDLRMQVYAEGRYFDLAEIKEALGFDTDFRSGAQLVIEFLPKQKAKTSVLLNNR